MTAVFLYASLLGFLLIFLSAHVIVLRRKLNCNFGDGGDPRLQRAIAAHANFSQYTAFALLLLLLISSLQVSLLLVHVLGLMLLLGRCLHAWGLISGALVGRAVGIGLTLSMIGFSAAYLLYVVIIFAVL
jgi:uncharacterized membrane protein YecN with MAPEG domain